MTLDMGNTDKLCDVCFRSAEVRHSRCCRRASTQSGVDFGAEPPAGDAKSGAIRYSLAALKNIGAGAVETIVNESEAKRPFASRLPISRAASMPRR